MTCLRRGDRWRLMAWTDAIVLFIPILSLNSVWRLRCRYDSRCAYEGPVYTSHICESRLSTENSLKHYTV